MLLPEQRAALIHQAKVLRQAKLRVQEDMTPEEFRRSTATLRECYEDVRRLHFSSARELGLLPGSGPQRGGGGRGDWLGSQLHQSLEHISNPSTRAPPSHECDGV